MKNIRMCLVGKNVVKNLISTRRSIHISSRLNINPQTVEEIRVQVPWGYITGKRWGDNNSQPIIALHGLVDNSATFDKLIPLLETSSVLSLDYTGHGLSSHLPKGTSLYYMDNILQLRYIFKYLYNWDKNLIFLGHSFGSSFFFNYAAIFPEDVSKMINIDCGRYWNSIDFNEFINLTKTGLDNNLNAEKYYAIEKGCSFEECVNRTMKARSSLNFPLTKESCEVLCSRGTCNMGNGKYYFTNDRRHKDCIFDKNTHAFNLALASRIKCKVLNIHANLNFNAGKYAIEENKHIKTLSENCESCEHLEFDASHHIHLETPEVIAPCINEFLNS